MMNDGSKQREIDKRTIPYKLILEERELPKYWYNVRADMTKKPAPNHDSRKQQEIDEAWRQHDKQAADKALAEQRKLEQEIKDYESNQAWNDFYRQNKRDNETIQKQINEMQEQRNRFDAATKDYEVNKAWRQHDNMGGAQNSWVVLRNINNASGHGTLPPGSVRKRKGHNSGPDRSSKWRMICLDSEHSVTYRYNQ